MSRDLRESESTGSNVGDTGFVNDSWFDDQDDIKDGDNEVYHRDSTTDLKAQERARAPISILVLILILINNSIYTT